MTDDRLPPTSEEMIRRAREELARIPERDAAPPERPGRDPLQDRVVPPPPIRPRRVISRSSPAVMALPRRLLVAIAVSGLLVIAGVVMALISAAAP